MVAHTHKYTTATESILVSILFHPSSAMSTKLRRKALQDFYHIQNLSSDKIASSNASIPESIGVDDVEEYATKSCIEDILALRNVHTDKLNLLKLSKKSIIYNNYSELINLSNVLKEFETVHEKTTKEDDFEGLLDELVEFSKEKVSGFNVNFKDLLLVDDDSSIRGTVEMEIEDDSIDKSKLMEEITHLLRTKKLSTTEVDDVEKIIHLLLHDTERSSSLLLQQLMEIKRK